MNKWRGINEDKLISWKKKYIFWREMIRILEDRLFIDGKENKILKIKRD